HWPQFWGAFLEWSEIEYEGDPSVVCTGDDVEMARFFPDVRLSYTEALLARDAWPADRAAVTALDSNGEREQLTRGQPAERVDSPACEHGNRPGTRPPRSVRLQPSAVRHVLVGNDRAAEVHRARRRRHAAGAPEGAPAARKPPSRREALLPHEHRLDDVELAA